MSHKPPSKKRRQREKAIAAQAAGSRSPAPPVPSVATTEHAEPSRNGVPSPQSRNERFTKHLINAVFGVIGVGAAPMIAHAIASLIAGEGVGWMPKEMYLLALVLWGGAYYEVRCNPEERFAQAWQRVYHVVMHWLSPVAAGAMALAYGFIEVPNPHTVDLSAYLARNALSGVMWALAAYFVYKVPLLWGDAKEAVLKG